MDRLPVSVSPDVTRATCALEPPIGEPHPGYPSMGETDIRRRCVADVPPPAQLLLASAGRGGIR